MWLVRPGRDTVPRRDVVQMAALDEAVGPPLLHASDHRLPYGDQWLKKNNVPHTDWLAKNRMNWAIRPERPYPGSVTARASVRA